MNIKFLFLLTVCCVASGAASQQPQEIEDGRRKIEVTASDYCNFLNEVEGDDLPSFYDGYMDSIVRTGRPGSYSYEVIEEKKEINYVSQENAARYCEWFKNTAPNFQLLSSISQCDSSLQSNHLSFSITDASVASALTEKQMDHEETGASLKGIVVGLVGLAAAVLGEERVEDVDIESHEIRTDEEYASAVTQQERRTIVAANNTRYFGSRNSSQERELLDRNNEMHISPRSDDSVRPFDAEEFAQEEPSAHAVVGGKPIQVYSSSSHVPSDRVMAMQEGIRKIESRKVAFNLPPKAEIGPESSSASSSKGQEKQSVLGSRKLKELTTGIEIAIDDIPEGVPDKAARVAAIYAAAYPRIKMQLQGLLSVLQNDVALQTDKNAIVLANTAIELVNASFNVVNLETVLPMKVVKELDYHVIGTTRIPFRVVPFSKEIEPSDYESAAVVNAGYNIINDLKESINVLKSSDDLAGQALHDSQLHRAQGAWFVVSKKRSAAQRKWSVSLQPNLQTTDQSASNLIQASLHAEVKRAGDSSNKCADLSRTIGQATPIADPIEARKGAVADILELAESALEIVDQSTAMLASRIMHR